MLSIIIPTYNSEGSIEKCLQSVKNQLYSNFEIIIIDGLSTDRTMSIIADFVKNDPRIRCISEKDQGIYDAMNKGIKMAKGEWLYFLGSDDKLMPNSLDNIFSRNLSKVDVIYSNVLNESYGGVYAGEFDFEKLLNINICHQSIFFRKSIFERTGTFNLKYKALADWDHNMKWFLNDKINKLYVDDVIAIYSDGGFSSQFIDNAFYEDRMWNFIKYGKRVLPHNLKNRIWKIILKSAIKQRKINRLLDAIFYKFHFFSKKR